MGGFRSKPVVDKDSSDGGNDKLEWGACSMQGWRLTQEDAHNCIVDYDANTSFFAVYDGHGGHEVSEYCAKRLPDFVKGTEAYREGDLEKALVDGYLGFDATLTREDVIEQLKRISQEKPPEETDDSEDDNEDYDEMYEEASMPIEEVIEKYKSGVEEKKEKRESSCSAASSSSGYASSSGSSKRGGADSEASSTKKDEEESLNGVSGSTDGAGQSSEISESCCKNGTPDSTENQPDSSVKETEAASKNSENVADSSTCVNGSVSTSDSEDSAAKQENGNISPKGKGKALMKTKGVVNTPPKKPRERRTATDLYKQFLNAQCDDEDSDSDSEDENDKSFESPHDDSSDYDSEEVSNVVVGEDNSEDSDDAQEEEDKDDENDDEEDADENAEGVEGLRSKIRFRDIMKHGPGMDSGCTAVVAILRGNELYVANAGDSRCVVCRSGKAVPMSFDHKPFQEIECERIKKAGGYIDCDKRVNGGLNLSRAIGDHAYKQNKALSDREQMITALPDVNKITIDPARDEFMVLACDGVWDCYSNQDVVDFVKERLQEGREKLSQICEEMFDLCLPKHNMCFDTGCDNMTAIIVQFKSSSNLKRQLSPSTEGVSEKRAKTDDTSEKTGEAVV